MTLVSLLLMAFTREKAPFKSYWVWLSTVLYSQGRYLRSTTQFHMKVCAFDEFWIAECSGDGRLHASLVSSTAHPMDIIRHITRRLQTDAGVENSLWGEKDTFGTTHISSDLTRSYTIIVAISVGGKLGQKMDVPLLLLSDAGIVLSFIVSSILFQSSHPCWCWPWWWRVTTCHSHVQQWSSQLYSLSINVSDITNCFLFQLISLQQFSLTLCPLGGW
jgi:hypothetical protein